MHFKGNTSAHEHTDVLMHIHNTQYIHIWKAIDKKTLQIRSQLFLRDR